MKTCAECKTEKSDTEFGRHRGGLYHKCRDCKKSYDRWWYRNRADKASKRRSTTNRRQAIRMVVFDFLCMHPCIDCGEDDVVVLEFDHQKNNKLAGVAQLLQRGAGIQKVIDEIAKCVVRCANCHRRRTAVEGNWYKRKTI